MNTNPFLPYGRGEGSPLAAGPAAFDVPPERQIDVVAGDVDFTRRQRRSNRQELGFAPEAEAGYPAYDGGDAAGLDVPSFAGSPGPRPGSATQPTLPDDANTAAPMVRT